MSILTFLSRFSFHQVVSTTHPSAQMCSTTQSTSSIYSCCLGDRLSLPWQRPSHILGIRYSSCLVGRPRGISLQHLVDRVTGLLVELGGVSCSTTSSSDVPTSRLGFSFVSDRPDLLWGEARPEAMSAV